MPREDLLAFLASQEYGVLATLGPDGRPQAATIGIAVTPDLEIVFDTVQRTRKYANLRREPACCLVIGCSGAATVQYEGEARELAGEELERYQKIYFARHPDGPERLKWEGIVYFAVRPRWIRFTRYGEGPPRIEEYPETPSPRG